MTGCATTSRKTFVLYLFKNSLTMAPISTRAQPTKNKMMNVGASWPRSFIPIKNMTADSSANNAPATTRMATTATPPPVKGRRRCRQETEPCSVLLLRPVQDPSAWSLVSLAPSIGMTRIVLFSEILRCARAHPRLLRMTERRLRRAQDDKGKEICRLVRTDALLGQNDRETLQNKFLTVALKLEKKASPAGLPERLFAAVCCFNDILFRRYAGRDILFRRYTACAILFRRYACGEYSSTARRMPRGFPIEWELFG